MERIAKENHRQVTMENNIILIPLEGVNIGGFYSII